MLRSRGRRVLFADADGATKFADIGKLEAELTKLELTSKAGNFTISSCCSQIPSHVSFSDNLKIIETV